MWTYPLVIPEVKLNTVPLPPTLQHHQILCLTFPQPLVQHPNLLLQIDWKLYSRYQRQIHFAIEYLSNCSMEKHHYIKHIFTHVKGLLYKHIMDLGQKFLALVIPKSWIYTVLVEAHNKLQHQGNTHTYCLIKRQYYWKGMNKDI